MTDTTKPERSPWLKRAPILVILAVAALGAFTLRDYLSFDALAENRHGLIVQADATTASSRAEREAAIAMIGKRAKSNGCSAATSCIEYART